MNHLLNSLRVSLPYRVLEWRGPVRGFIDPPHATRTNVRITGGIGDLLLGLGVCNSLNTEVGDVHVYSKYPEIARLFSNLPQSNDSELFDGKGERVGWDWYIVVNSPAFFKFAHNFDGFHNEKLNDILLRNRAFLGSGEWARIVEDHPHLDGMAARMAVARGLNRETLPYAFLGLEKVAWKMPDVVSNFILNRDPTKKYITLHDGVDSNHKDVKRATKMWSMDHWKAFVRMFKVHHPDYKVVQLGGPNSRHIPGVDVDLVSALTFEQSVEVLAGSSCHIDGDSGLVHTARLLKVKSVVMFGPTPADFFGYKQNRNISPNLNCSDCFWLQSNWVKKCPAGYDKPECMESIGPEEVLFAVKESL